MKRIFSGRDEIRFNESARAAAENGKLMEALTASKKDLARLRPKLQVNE